MERPADWNVPLAFNAPATCKPAPTEDEALEIKPPWRVASEVEPRMLKVPDAEILPSCAT